MRIPALLALCLIILSGQSSMAAQKNGFEIGNASVPIDKILHGGPPKDGIPSIDRPVFEPPDEASLWRERVGSEGRVLSPDTGYHRNYRMSPYGDYDHTERLFFPVTHTSQKYHPKTWVLGWTHNGESKAWPFPELQKTGLSSRTRSEVWTFLSIMSPRCHRRS